MELPLEQIKEELLSRSFLYEHPATYRAAVEETLGAVGRTLLEDEPAQPRELQTSGAS